MEVCKRVSLVRLDLQAFVMRSTREVVFEHDVSTLVKGSPCLILKILLSCLHSVNELISRAARRFPKFFQIVITVDF